MDSGLIDVAGTLSINGTADNPVIITSAFDDIGGDTNRDAGATFPEAGNWEGITIREGATANVTNAIIRYAGTSPSWISGCGYTCGQPGIFKNEGGTLTVTDSTLSDDFLLVRHILGTTTITNSSLLRSVDGIFCRNLCNPTK